MEKATFAAGCFWGVEAAFRRIPGVVDTVVGYTGGNMTNPSYRDVCTDRTGHAEAIEITFDSAKISYAQLLDQFWQLHDPTTPNRQGPDVGAQYRSAIFFHDPEQEKTAIAAKQQWQNHFRHPIVTQIVPATTFYPAEDYHQRYLEKKGLTTCHL